MKKFITNLLVVTKQFVIYFVHKLRFLSEEIFSDATSLNALQIHWTIEWFGGSENVLRWDVVDENKSIDFDKRLLLTNYGLLLLKNCSLKYCTEKYLIDVQNSATHLAVLDGIAKLTGLVFLSWCNFTFNFYYISASTLRYF